MLTQDYFEEIRGAAYIPVRTCNAYQQWKEYNHDIADRDMGFAQKLHINAVRLWLSYEFWLESPDKFAESFEDFVTTASKKGIRVMPAVFECCGTDPSPETMNCKDQFYCDAVRSPGNAITADKKRWHEPFKFLDWFMDIYKFDNRILAVEVTNEPKNVNDHRFAIALLQRAKSACGDIPVTLGCEQIADNVLYKEFIDIYQTHENMPLSKSYLEHVLYRAKLIEEVDQKPLWVTEWQQIRQGGWGMNGESPKKADLRPHHNTIAPSLHAFKTGNFIWNLMLRPSYLKEPRAVGTFNGIFHEDGSVYSLEDARAVANDPTLVLVENHSLPACFDRVAALSEE